LAFRRRPEARVSAFTIATFISLDNGNAAEIALTELNIPDSEVQF
jgi:hypothetical protein